MDTSDKVTRYTILSLGAASWLFLMYLVFVVFQNVSHDASLLNQLVGFMQAIGLGGLGLFVGHKTGKNKGTPP